MRRRRWARVLWIAAVLVGWAAAAAAQEHRPLREERPALLMPLYISFAGLQALDVHSTLRATASGARETNPVVRSALASPTSLVLLKTGSSAAVVMLSEKLWPHNRAAALITMVALNSADITIAAHNYRQNLTR